MRTPEQIAALFADCANPDKLAAALTSLNEEIKELSTAVETMTNDGKAKDATIADLRDTNMKLFLRQTGAVEDTPPEEDKTPEDIIREFTENTVAYITENGGK